jgi:hypothetical protein
LSLHPNLCGVETFRAELHIFHHEYAGNAICQECSCTLAEFGKKPAGFLPPVPTSTRSNCSRTPATEAATERSGSLWRGLWPRLIAPGRAITRQLDQRGARSAKPAAAGLPPVPARMWRTPGFGLADDAAGSGFKTVATVLNRNHEGGEVGRLLLAKTKTVATVFVSHSSATDTEGEQAGAVRAARRPRRPTGQRTIRTERPSPIKASGKAFTLQRLLRRGGLVRLRQGRVPPGARWTWPLPPRRLALGGP